ncbi:beta family protein [Streptomyces sp. TLI_105]|uniref:beta family protein n=1 Tax=Streptomyces sp. TLI_105 TaxID=1881019 RepID=UPI00089AFE37|nr:beta family protein [Streptomyces sp. TLI_105]SEC12938.1 Beta protein [Streptomyces sp. TLI_105]
MTEPLSVPPSEPLYVPALPARPSALAAYDRLAPGVRAGVAPLWSVPPRTGGARTLGRRPYRPLDPDPSALARHLRTALRRLVGVQRGLPAWVDAFHAEDEPRHLVTEFRQGLAGTPLRPVTGFERDVRQQTASAEAARASGNGLGVRVFLHALPDEPLRDEIRGLLARIAFAGCPVDLLLDLGGVVDEHHPAEKWALRALALLGPLHPWRTVAVLAGSFPRTFPEGYGAPLAEAQRFDWDLWHMLADGPERPGVRVTYGDYGADHTGGVDRPSEAGGGSPWGIVRYTTDRTFLLGRVPTQGSGHADAVRALVREIVHAEDFRGAGFSEGERRLVGCAEGNGSRGAGTPAVWLGTGHIQHMAQVVRGLRRHS